MAVAIQGEWPGFTAEQYDQLNDVVGLEREVPLGLILHVASFSPEGAHIFDVWESEEAAQRFWDERLIPKARQPGIPGVPKGPFPTHPGLLRSYPVHAIFTPGGR